MQMASVITQVDGASFNPSTSRKARKSCQGQPLFRIDARPYQNAYDQAMAMLARDSATWVNAQANAVRTKSRCSPRR